VNSVTRLLVGVLLGAVLVGAVWFGGWVEPPEALARSVAAWSAVYPGPVGEAEVTRIECPPLERVRLYLVCTNGCQDVWRIVLVKGLQPTLLANLGRLPSEDVATSRRRINAAVGREALRLDAGGARAMIVCYMRLEGLTPGLVLPDGGLEAVEAARAEGEEAMRTYALGLADPEAAARIPVTPTAEGFESRLLYWDTFREGHPVFRLSFKLARDGQVRAMVAEPLARSPAPTPPAPSSPAPP
jgi:hypothetical protein